jgi:hypothetical protein
LEERKKKKKKEMTADNKSLIICCHALSYKEEDTLGLLKTRQKGRFGHRMVSHAPTTFLNKKIFFQMKNTRIPSMNLRITKKKS